MNPFQESSVEDNAKRERERKGLWPKRRLLKIVTKKQDHGISHYFSATTITSTCMWIYGNMVSRTTKCTCDVKWIKAIKMHKGT
jgi:hypothetical protein